MFFFVFFGISNSINPDHKVTHDAVNCYRFWILNPEMSDTKIVKSGFKQEKSKSSVHALFRNEITHTVVFLTLDQSPVKVTMNLKLQL